MWKTLWKTVETVWKTLWKSGRWGLFHRVFHRVFHNSTKGSAALNCLSIRLQSAFGGGMPRESLRLLEGVLA